MKHIILSMLFVVGMATSAFAVTQDIYFDVNGWPVLPRKVEVVQLNDGRNGVRLIPIELKEFGRGKFVSSMAIDDNGTPFNRDDDTYIILFDSETNSTKRTKNLWKNNHGW